VRRALRRGAAQARRTRHAGPTHRTRRASAHHAWQAGAEQLLVATPA